MPQLSIALQSGFDDDTVVISVDGAQVLRRRGVSTDTRVSLAAKHDVTVDDGSTRVEVALPERGLSSSVTLTITGDTHVGVSVDGGEIRFRESSQAFGYL
jgi:hypothetical protein